ncbi:MAG: hypothetical protein P0120_24595 [Nitrospira sp.]|nr:hypothetical protein [Nitrospira sp.]
MGETPSSQTVPTRLQQIAERARQLPAVGDMRRCLDQRVGDGS